MTQSRFFQLSLLLPFALWCLYLAFSAVAGSRGISFVISNVAGAYPVFVPYLVFAALLWKWSAGKPYKQLLLIASIAPLLWGPFYTLAHMLQFFIKDHAVEQWSVVCIMFFWATIAGYLVEAVPLVILAIFRNDFRTD